MDLQNETVHVSSEFAILPQGLTAFPEFLSEEEAALLLDELDESQRWLWEGFTQRRRVQQYDVNSQLPERLEQLLMRFQKLNNQKRRPQHIVVEEFPFQTATVTTASAVVTMFETATKVDDNDNDYFIAQMAICSPAVQHLNRPRKRVAESWQLQSKHHWADLRMAPRMLFVKSGQALWDWRSRVTRSTECHDDNDRVVVVKFHHLPEEKEDVMDEVTADVVMTTDEPRDEMPPLKDILTIIVTTSPIRSHPSTEVMERTFETFSFGGEEFLKCPKVIICDGLRLQDESGKVSKKHANEKQALRNGIATTRQAENYEEFKRRLVTLCQGDDATRNPAFINTTVEQLTTRHGYGFALRHALQNCVTTPYVCVIQHDRTFMRPTPIVESMRAMWHHHRKIKYIGVSMRSNLIYRDIFMSKYGKPAMEELGDLVLRPPELLVDATEYGPDSSSVQNMTIPTEKLRTNLESVRDLYMVSIQNRGQLDWLANTAIPAGKHQMSLTPTLFWYDNTHLVETAHYRDYIFHPKYKMVAKGGFVEETTSPVMIKAVERLGLAAGHEKFGCYLLDDHSGYFFNGHLDGGTYVPVAERAKMYGVCKDK